MRAACFLLLLSFLAPAPAVRADVEVVRVWPGYRTAESFVGIGEYFGRPEPTRGRILLRTQPEERSGYYWLLRVKTDRPAEATLQLEVIRTGQPEPVAYTLPLTLPAGSRAIFAGLTGTDWADTHERPVAWRVRIVEVETERELASAQSFLWALPAAE